MYGLYYYIPDDGKTNVLCATYEECIEEFTALRPLFASVSHYYVEITDPTGTLIRAESK